MLKKLRQLFCPHKSGKILTISFDGETVFKCDRCDKIVRIPLR